MAARRWLAVALLVVGVAHSHEARAQTLGTRVRVTTSSAVNRAALAQLVDPSLQTATVTQDGHLLRIARDGTTIALVPLPGATVVGIVQAAGPAAIVLLTERDRAIVTVPRPAIDRIERSAGEGTRWRHVGWGAAIGAGAGAVMGLVAEMGCDPDAFLGCWIEAAAIGGAMLGSSVGAITGALLPPDERWVGIDAPERARTSGTPAAGRWRVSGGLGHPLGGPAKGIEREMRALGLDATEPSFLGRRPISHPRSYTGFWEIGRPFTADAAYRFGGRWRVGAAATRSPIGETHGYRAPAQRLTIDYAVSSVSFLAVREFGPIHAGAGPAWHQVATRSLFELGDTWQHRSLWGVTAEAGLNYPLRTRLYLDARARYQYVGRAMIGPYGTSGPTGTNEIVLEARVPFNHWFIGVSGGVRF